MSSSPEVVLGIAWFRPDQWDLLRSVSADPEVLEPTYDEWEKLARRTIHDLAREGILARKVDVDVERLQDWCKAQQRRWMHRQEQLTLHSVFEMAPNSPNQTMQRTAFPMCVYILR